MAIRQNTSPTVRLTDNRFEQPLTIDMQAFFEFSFDMAEDLLDLEAKFGPPATGDCLEAAAKAALWM